jgi:hypothetical protein
MGVMSNDLVRKEVDSLQEKDDGGALASLDALRAALLNGNIRYHIIAFWSGTKASLVHARRNRRRSRTGDWNSLSAFVTWYALERSFFSPIRCSS